MKNLHRDDLFGWSVFDEPRNLDFNSLAWIRPDGNVLVDPLPLSVHDRAQLEDLGGAAHILITTSDHLRAGASLAAEFGARLWVPRAEAGSFADMDATPLSEGSEPVPGLQVFELEGSKTPGELALLLEGSTLITGDLIRGQHGGRLNLLPAAKLSDPAAARRAVARLAGIPGIETVLVGDGWHLWRGGAAALAGL